MIERKTWDEFRAAQLLWWVNRFLHIYGWALVCEMEGGKVANCYPAMVKFRGFTNECEIEGFIGLSRHIAENAERCAREAEQE